MKRFFITLYEIIIVLFIIGYIIPEKTIIPVVNATKDNWNPRSFWYYPWGESITHKGIDIFSLQGSVVIAPVSGLIIEKGYGSVAGNYMYILGPHWHVHYLAHLEKITTTSHFIYRGEPIGLIGTTGNANGKEPHVHYSITTVVPYVWNYDGYAEQGWMKCLYLNPEDSF